MKYPYSIIDAHTHIEGLPDCEWQDPPELMLRLMDEANIDQAIVMTYCDAPLDHPTYNPLDYVHQAVKQYPERLWAFARLNPGSDQAVSLLEEAVLERGFKGLKLHPFGYRIPPDDPCTLTLLQAAARLNVPALFHCGDEEYTLPLQLERAAKECPQTAIIFGHMGGYFHVADAIKVAKRCPNVYLETSATPHVGLIREAIDCLGAHRVIYASDGPGCDPSIEVEKIKLIGLSAADQERVFRANILRLIGMEG